MRGIAAENVDFTLLLENTQDVQQRLRQMHSGLPLANLIPYLPPLDGKYYLCGDCLKHATTSNPIRFKRVPPLAIANALDCGSVPPEIADLTLAEQRCIALASATKCFAELRGGNRVTSEHACVFPQEPRLLGCTLPPPINEVAEDIAILLCAPTAEDANLAAYLHRSLIMVRRRSIMSALLWLVEHIPLYANLTLSEENLSQCLENGRIPLPALVQDATSELRNDTSAEMSTERDGASYTSRPVPHTHGSIKVGRPGPRKRRLDEADSEEKRSPR